MAKLAKSDLKCVQIFCGRPATDLYSPKLVEKGIKVEHLPRPTLMILYPHFQHYTVQNTDPTKLEYVTDRIEGMLWERRKLLSCIG